MTKSPNEVVIDQLKRETSLLRERWQKLTEENPKLRIRDAAVQLGVSEAELLATGCGDNVTRLEANWPELVKELGSLGSTMALTRNEHIVHEKIGVYKGIDAFHGMGLVAGPDIDLRLFYSHWHLGFAVKEESQRGTRHSLQFFDIDGEATHKVYLQEEGDYAAYDTLVAKYRSENQSPIQPIKSKPASSPTLKDEEVDVEGFQKAWRELEDTHAFFGLLSEYKVDRHQALRLAPEGYAQEIAVDAPRRLLEKAAQDSTPIMVFVGNPGTLQIHTGPVKTIKPFGEWINVLDPKFSLHLRETGVASAWIVRKPTSDGDVTSVELFDQNGENLAMFFGARKPGKPEREDWRALAASLAA